MVPASCDHTKFPRRLGATLKSILLPGGRAERDERALMAERRGGAIARGAHHEAHVTSRCRALRGAEDFTQLEAAAGADDRPLVHDAPDTYRDEDGDDEDRQRERHLERRRGADGDAGGLDDG